MYCFFGVNFVYCYYNQAKGNDYMTKQPNEKQIETIKILSESDTWFGAPFEVLMGAVKTEDEAYELIERMS